MIRFEKKSEELSDNKNKEKRSASKTRKIFTCAEIEGRNQPKPKAITKMKVATTTSNDPAILHFAQNTTLTRYDKAELKSLQDSKQSQSPPQCLYDPRVIKLNILKYEEMSHSPDYEEALKIFRDKLQNLTLTSWDPKLLQLLNNYHNSLLFPGVQSTDINQFRPPRMNQVLNRPQRQVSFVDQKQILDSRFEKVPSYDRKINFFDNITTTTTLRQTPRMGVNSFSYQNKRHPQNPFVRNAKVNSCSNERFTSYPISNKNNISSGSAYTDETRSCDSSIEKSMDKAEECQVVKNDQSLPQPGKKHLGNDEAEPEPEWFSWPASRQDMIDLHGFDDDEQDDSLHSTTPISGDGNDRSAAPMNNKSAFDEFLRAVQPSAAFRRSSYNQSNQRYPNQRNWNAYQNISCVGNNSSYYHPRYRNPLHNSKSSSSSFNSSCTASDYGGDMNPSMTGNMNPFFEAWRHKNVQQENFNYVKTMGAGRFPKVSASPMRNIAEVENAIKQSNMLNAMIKQDQQNRRPPTLNLQHDSVPQFFQNAAGGSASSIGGPNGTFWDRFHYSNMPTPPLAQQQRSSGRSFINDNFQMPTPEQLQQHTSEIMRNALMRKQPYHDESKYAK